MIGSVNNPPTGYGKEEVDVSSLPIDGSVGDEQSVQINEPRIIAAGLEPPQFDGIPDFNLFRALFGGPPRCRL